MAALRPSFVLTLASIGVATIGGCSGMLSNHDVIRVDSPNVMSSAPQLTRDGVRAVERGKLGVAETTFKRAIRADETYGPAHNNLGRVYFQRRDLQRAAKAFGWAIDFMPGRPEPMNNLAMVYEAAGKSEDAIELYQAAHEARPDEPEYLANLVRARILRGDQGEQVRSELQTLKFIENRPEWIAWVDRTLALSLPSNALLKKRQQEESLSSLNRERGFPLLDDESSSESTELELTSPRNDFESLQPLIDSVEHF